MPIQTKRLISALVLILVALVSGCPKPAGGSGEDGGGMRIDEADGGVSEPDAEATSEQDGGPVVEVPDAGPPPQVAPSLVSATARQSGRFGDDVRLDARGSDPDGDATSLSVALFDAMGAPVIRYDDNGDGVLDTHQTVFPLIEPIRGSAEGDAAVVLSGFHRSAADVSDIEIALVDAGGRRSASMRLTVQEQPVLAIDALCDPAFVANRCGDGLGCRAAVPAVCREGVAPSLTRVVYVMDPGTAGVLIEGTDADDDLSAVDIEFFDAAGAAVSLDLDGDGVRESSRFRADIRDASRNGAFFYALHASDAFATDVAKVAVTAIDRGMRTSARVEAAKRLAPTRRVGEACDERGFDRCTGSVCIRSGMTSRCADIAMARRGDCAAAPVIDAFAPASAVEGVATGASLWDAPAGCSSGDPSARPEGTVRLHVSRAASRIVLTTANAYSSFDTTVYALGSCDGAPVVAWCADDMPGTSRSWLSRLELRDVPAGDYVVVVDSFSPEGGRFRLDVMAE